MTVPRAGVIVDPKGQTVTVTVNSPAGTAVTGITSDNGGVTASSNPLTITAPTAFYLPANGQVNVSGVANGATVLNRNIYLDDSSVTTVACSIAEPAAQTAYSGFLPAGWLCESFPRIVQLTASGSQTLVSGTLELAAVYLPQGVVVSDLMFNNMTTAAVTPTHQWMGLYDSNLNQLATTADQGTGAIGSSANFVLPVATTAAGASSTFTTTYSGLYYIGLLVVAATMPTVEGRTAGTGFSRTMAPILCGASDTSQTTPPAFPHVATTPTSAAGVIYVGAK